MLRDNNFLSGVLKQIYVFFINSHTFDGQRYKKKLLDLFFMFANKYMFYSLFGLFFL